MRWFQRLLGGLARRITPSDRERAETLEQLLEAGLSKERAEKIVRDMITPDKLGQRPDLH